MSKIGLFADVHIHPYARFSSVTEDGLNTWVKRALDVLDQIYDECARRGITRVYSLGDLFHTGPRLSTRMFNEVYRFFEERKKAGFLTTLIAGNHDQLARSGSESALYCLKEAVDRVVDEPELRTEGIALLPYTEDYVELRRLLSENQLRVILGHLAVAGAVVGRHEYQPKEGCDPSWLDYAPLVLLGHYHKRQAVTNQVRYIGSAMAIDFNDANEQKGFTILDTETLETEFVSIDATSFRVIDDYASEAHVIAGADYSGDIVRIDHSGDLDEETVRVTMLERGATAVIFKRTVARQVKQRVLDPETDLKGCVQEYVASNNTDGLDSESLVKLGLEIIHEASQAPV